MVKFYVEQNRKGDMELVNYVWDEDRYTEINNTDFDAIITVKEEYKGRSAGGVILNVAGHPEVPLFEAHMSIKEFIRIIKNADMEKGAFRYRLKFRKQGANCFVVGADYL